MKKVRIDTLLVDRKLVPSREKAKSLLMAGLVLVDEAPVTKPGRLISLDAAIRIRGEDHPFVGRGGVKLKAALDAFGCDIRNKICMDVGASTGGFTDCLLQSGASRVYAIDVGYGQLAQRIARDPRVVVIDRQNIRYLKAEKIPEPIDIAAIDVSFISLELVLPVVDLFLSRRGIVIALIKPQFEVGPKLVGKGGIVRDESARQAAITKIKLCGEGLGWSCSGVISSPIKGAKGNKEYLILFQK